MKRQQLISKGSLNRILHGASLAWHQGDYEQSLDSFERASRLDPANFKILLDMGQRYGSRYRWADMERCFEKAIRIAPNQIEVLITAGRMATELGSHTLAESLFKKALTRADISAEGVAALAELYERLHRTEDCGEMVHRALHLDRSCALARLIQAKLHRQAGRFQEAEQVLCPFLANASRELKVRALYELGAIYDRAGRYDEAMHSFMDAKSLLQQDAPPLHAQLQVIVKFLKDMQENISSETVARWFTSTQQFAQENHRLAFLGGHARSGTTLLEQVLDSHPDIVSADETNIFHNEVYTPLRRKLPRNTSMLDGLDITTIETFQLARQRYFRSMNSCLHRPLEKRLLIDKNPSLQVFILAFARVFPEAKLIIALRDPRDVVLSCFMQPHLPLGTASVNYLNLKDTTEAYCRTMGIWRTLSPLLKNHWTEVRYEEMVADLESVARKTLTFLGVTWDAEVLGFNKHAQKKLIRSPTYADVTQSVYKRAHGRWRNYEKYLSIYLEQLKPFLKAFGYE